MKKERIAALAVAGLLLGALGTIGTNVPPSADAAAYYYQDGDRPPVADRVSPAASMIGGYTIIASDNLHYARVCTVNVACSTLTGEAAISHTRVTQNSTCRWSPNPNFAYPPLMYQLCRYEY